MPAIGTLDHVFPTACSTSGRYQRPSNELPTAQASSGAAAQRALRSALSGPAGSTGTTRQFRPVVRRLNARSPLLPLVAPTTHAPRRLQAAIPFSVALCRLAGAGTEDQFRP